MEMWGKKGSDLLHEGELFLGALGRGEITVSDDVQHYGYVDADVGGGCEEVGDVRKHGVHSGEVGVCD
jgi:hypothetical protein